MRQGDLLIAVCCFGGERLRGISGREYVFPAFEVRVPLAVVDDDAFEHGRRGRIHVAVLAFEVGKFLGYLLFGFPLRHQVLVP